MTESRWEGSAISKVNFDSATRSLLVSLDAELRERGGHRPARAAVDAQLRRLEE